MQKLPLAPLPPPSDLVDQVYRRVQEAIVRGQLRPGQRITQEDLASQLGVSRQPVLQALRQLKQDGLVQDAPGRGVQITPLDVATIDQVYDIRQALDTLAVRLAAQQRAKVPIEVLTQGREAFARQDIQAMIEADMGFHRALYDASGNPLIARSAALHWQHLRRAMGLVLQSARIQQSVCDDHEALACAVSEGRGPEAEALIHQHSQRAREALTARLRDWLHNTETDHEPAHEATPARR